VFVGRRSVQRLSRRYHASLSAKPGNAALRPLGFGTTNTAAPAMRSGFAPGPGLAGGPKNSRYAVRPTNATTRGRMRAIVRASRTRPLA
jgi:hypothetical protein